MKILRLSSIVLALLLLSTPAWADVPAPGGPFDSSFTIRNLDQANQANCSVEIHDSNGVAPNGALSEIQISAGGNYFVYVPGRFSSLTSGRYSAVVSCDCEIAVVSNFSDADSGASYSGVSKTEASLSAYLPGLYKDYYGYNSNVVVQNAGDAPADIRLKVYKKGNSTPVLDVTEYAVEAGSSVEFDQAVESIPSGLLWAEVSSAEPIAAVGQINSTVQLYSYNGFASGSTVAYTPSLFNNYYGWNSSLTVLNLGNTSTSLTIYYSNGYTVGPVSVKAKDFYFSYTPGEPGIPSGSLVSARIESSPHTVVALVNESNAINRAASYNGFASGTTNWVAPIIMKQYYSYDTSITCQNIGTSNGSITVTYSNGWSESKPVLAGKTALFYQPSAGGLPDGFNGSAGIEGTVDIVCVVNENQETNTSSGDWLFAYNAIPQAVP